MIDFKMHEALNFCLLDQLLSDRDKYKEQLQNFLYIIWNTEPVEFVSQFLEKSAAREKFVEEFNIYWVGANHWIITTDGFTVQQKRCYVKDTLCVSSDAVIAQTNEESEIKEFIERDPEFLAFQDIDEDIIAKRLKVLQIKFQDINFETANANLLRFVYDNDMYVLKVDIVKNILMYYYSITAGFNLLGKSLSFALSRDDQPLCRYVKDNIDLYIGELLSAAQETEDTEEIVLYVLNSDDESITEEHKKAYIASSKTIITHLNGVDDTKWWNELLEQDKVQKTAENLWDYYFKSGRGMDDVLVHFINSFEQDQMRAIADMDDKYEESDKKKLFIDITRCNEIKNDKYEEIVRAFNIPYTTFNETGIEPKKIEILIRKDILEMNADILKTMRGRYEEVSMLFIMNNIEKYVEIMNVDIFSASELMQILEKNIDDELKIRLLQFATAPIPIQNKNYSEKIQDYIVENLYSNEDFEYLVQWYPSNRVKLRKQILTIATEAIQNAEDIPCVMHAKLLESLILSKKIDATDMQALLARQIKLGLQKGVAKTAFEQLGMPEYKQLLEGKPIKVEITDTGEQLLGALKEKKWISDYEEDKDNPEMFQAFGKAAKKEKKILSMGTYNQHKRP